MHSHTTDLERLEWPHFFFFFNVVQYLGAAEVKSDPISTNGLTHLKITFDISNLEYDVICYLGFHI